MLFLFTPPLAIVTNIVAICKDKSKTLGVVGLVLSLLTCLVYCLPMLCL